MKWTRHWKTRLLLILAVIGPGFITANVDNDAGGIWTYSAAGAQYGYGLLWTLIPTTIALIVVQEMAARLGAVTGKGLSDLIREEYGLRMTAFVMVGLVICNFGNVIAEFAGIASSLQLFGVPKYYSVPICALLVWALVVKGNYKNVEKIFLAASFVYFAYIIAGWVAGPAWKEALVATVKPSSNVTFRDSAYVYMIIGVIGTTIAPWMPFYLQASIVEKGVTPKQYKMSRWDVIIGCIFTDVVAWFIIVACAATLFVHGYHQVNDAADAAKALEPLAGRYAFILFAVGLFNASLFAASILPLSTAYTVCEGLGLESGVDKRFAEAPFFYWLYTLLIVGGGVTVLLLPDAQLVNVAILSQVLNGVLLPVVIILMLLLINRKDLMGEHKNTPLWNVIAWGTSLIVIGMTMVMLWGMIPGH